ncbi:MAG: hypothetical protein ACOYJB_04400 [Christensenellaceae bacterium]|jgi:hypothetical protein
MSAQIWMGIGIAGFAAAAALIIAAVLLFIRWRIPAVVGELSGRTEKKQIKKMQQAKIDAANKVNIRPQAYEQDMFAPAREQEKMPVQQSAEPTDVLGEQAASMGTEPLSAATDVLEPEEADANATTILSDVEAAVPPQTDRQAGDIAFRVVKSVVVVHTSEGID